MPSQLTPANPILPTDPVKFDHVPTWDIYRQVGINYADRVFARSMDADDPDSEITDITWGKLYRDALKVAKALKEKLGNPTEEITFGILANSSYVYYVNVIAGWLNHWTIILLSTRNSVAGDDSLLKAVKASALLTDAKTSKVAEAIVAELPLQLLHLIDPADIDDNTVEVPKGPVVDVTILTEEQYKKPAMYLHSSGTSGHPKPIPHTHAHIATDMISQRLNVTWPGVPGYAPLPLFHGIGFFSFSRWPISVGITPTFINTKQPLSSGSMLSHLKRLPGAIAFVAPMLLEDALREPEEDHKILATCTRIFHGGAPLDKIAEKKLVEMGAPLIGVFGTTETSMITVTDFPGPPETRVEDASYIKLTDHQYIYHWVPFDDKLVELIISEGPGKTAVPAVINHQNPVGYATQDLWEPHPTLKGVYKHCGRKDSVTVLSNGEKTDNRQIELLLMDDPLINGVVVFGAGRPLNGVLIRPDPSVQHLSSEEFLDAIWPTIEHVNEIVPGHSRLVRQMIIVADVVNKQFFHSDKGSIRTKDTLSLYAQEVEAAYDSLEAEVGGEAVKDVHTFEDIEKFVKETVLKVGRRPLGDNDDFFESGLDSLHAVQIRTAIKPLFAKFVQGEELPHNIAYAQPTIARLAGYLVARAKGEQIDLDDPKELFARIQATFERWSANLPVRERSKAPEPVKKTFALTGSTGSLGIHTLRYLLERDDVEKVYCLHRGTSDVAEGRHRKLFKDRLLPVELLDSSKVAFVSVDLSKPNLGLSTAAYDELRGSLTHIIHTAWELNFNWGIDRFEKVHIGGLRHLVDLSLASTLPSLPRFVFVSSIGVVLRHTPDFPVPEEPVDNPLLIGSRGYGEAKYVCERILDLAAEVSGLPVTVVRSGQIAGSSIDGYWAPNEYMPTIFRSSQILGKVPRTLPDTRWLPSDYCGKGTMDFAFQNDEHVQYYHLENPTSTPWNVISSLFIKTSKTKLEEVDTKEWLAAVEKASKEGSDIPAAALLQFYSEYSAADSRVCLGTDKSKKASEAISYGVVTPDLMEKYVSWVN